MNIHLPTFVCSLDLKPQDRLEDKLGGLPWGLPLAHWPLCPKCARPMTLVLQMLHREGRLDLGKEGRVLFAFQCDWRHTPHFTGLGANHQTQLFVLESEELETGLTYPPEPGATVFPEARVTGWSVEQLNAPPVAMEIGVAEMDREKKSWLDRWRPKPKPKPAPAPPTKEKLASRWETYLGDSLTWLRESHEVPANFRFLGQLTARMHFQGSLPAGVRDTQGRAPTLPFHGRFEVAANGWQGDGYWECFMFEPFNSWAAGLGYLFLEQPSQKRGVLAWQFADVLSARAPRLSDPFLGLRA